MSVLGTATAFAIHPFQSFVLKFRKFSTRWSRERSVRTGRKSSFIDRLSQGPTFHCVRVRFRVSLNALGCNLIAFLTSLLGERVVIQSAFAAICTRFRVSNHTQLHEQVRSANVSENLLRTLSLFSSGSFRFLWIASEFELLPFLLPTYQALVFLHFVSF